MGFNESRAFFCCPLLAYLHCHLHSMCKVQNQLDEWLACRRFWAFKWIPDVLGLEIAWRPMAKPRELFTTHQKVSAEKQLRSIITSAFDSVDLSLYSFADVFFSFLFLANIKLRTSEDSRAASFTTRRISTTSSQLAFAHTHVEINSV